MMLNIGLLLGFFFKCLFDEKKEENVGGIICLSGEKKVSVECGYIRPVRNITLSPTSPA